MWSRNSHNRLVRVEDISISSGKSNPALSMDGTHVENVRTPPLEANENPRLNFQENFQQDLQGNFELNGNPLEQQMLNQQNLNHQQNFQGIQHNANFNAQRNFQGNYQNGNFNGQQFVDPPPTINNNFLVNKCWVWIWSKKKG